MPELKSIVIYLSRLDVSVLDDACCPSVTCLTTHKVLIVLSSEGGVRSKA